MAKAPQGILGGIRGKIGNVVGSNWKGIAVLKSMPLSVANPKTAGQVAQRGKMTQAVKAGRALLAALITTYWNPFAQYMSGFNKFISENIATFTTAGFTTFADFYSMRGSLVGAIVTGVGADDSDNTIGLTWTDNSGTGDALGTDEVVVVVYNANQDYWLVDAGNAVRSDGSLNITDSNMSTGDELKVYTAFSRPDVSKVSDSVYNAVTVQA